MVTPSRITSAVPPAWIGNEYGSVCPFNCDNTRILVIAIDHFQLLDGNGAFLRDLPIGASERPKWSKSLPGVICFIRGNTLNQIDCETLAVNTLHTFTEYTTIDPSGESDLSDDGDHLVLCGDNTDAFVFTLSTGIKGPVFKVPTFDALKISPDNHIIISKSDGIFVVDLAMRQLSTTNGHADLCRDTDRSECLVYTSNLDNGVWKVPIAHPSARKLLCTPNWSLAVDVSACDKGFCIISTYGTAVTGIWANQVLKVALDGSGVEVLCDTKSNAQYYTAQPKASLSRDGSRFVFSSNDGKNIPNYCDVWLGLLTPTPPPSPFPGYHEVNPGTFDGFWYFKIVNGVTVATLYVKD